MKPPGRPRTPTVELNRRGSWRAKDREGEPQYETAIPTSPDLLDADAQAEWDRIVPELEQHGLITAVDRAALAAYCAAYSRWAAAERIIAAEGILTEGAHGGKVKHPAVSVANEAMMMISRFCGEFGLTPASRSRVIGSGGKKKKKDDKADFFTPKLAGT